MSGRTSPRHRLNKGPYAAEAVTILDGVLKRMQEHQHKKTPHLRALRMWHDYLA